VKASPFLKWCGGKSRLLPELLKRVPAEFNAYHEPFLGGGALFFALASEGHLDDKRVCLADANAELIECYRAVRDHLGDVHTHLEWILQMHRNDPRGTYERVKDKVGLTGAIGAARTIYLNKTCFNGLYRVNKKGLFNTPIGTLGLKTDPKVYCYEDLEKAAIRLRYACLDRCDYRHALNAVDPGDFCYLDPPYAPLSATSNFTAYTKDGFSAQDQAAVRDAALSAKNRGATVLISNSSADLIRDLYAGPEWKVEEVTVGRTGGTAKGRGSVKELLIS